MSAKQQDAKEGRSDKGRSGKGKSDKDQSGTGQSDAAPIDVASYATVTFDCYGTLIDWESGILEYLQPLFKRYYVNAIDEFVLGLFAELETEAQAEGGTYREVLARVMDRIATRMAITPNDEMRDGLATSIADWRPFDDAVPALKSLQERCKLGIVSNVDDDLFDASQKKLGVAFDYVITAERVGAYKPDLKVFEQALATVKSPVLHVAQSRFHDIAPAARLGLDTVLIDRPSRGTTSPAEANPTWSFPSLADFVAAIG